MKIFITGCAKSGTTLLGRLFYAFDNVCVIQGEINLSNFVLISNKNKIIVGKRKWNTIFSADLSYHVLAQHCELIERFGITIINMIRDGRDVITDKRIPVNRWIAAMKHKDQYAHIIDMTIKYEDLVGNSDKIQRQISEQFDLKPIYRFSDYPGFIPKHEREIIANWSFKKRKRRPQYGFRPIDTNSIGKDRERYKTLCKDAQELMDFEKCLERAGYG